MSRGAKGHAAEGRGITDAGVGLGEMIVYDAAASRVTFTIVIAALVTQRAHDLPSGSGGPFKSTRYPREARSRSDGSGLAGLAGDVHTVSRTVARQPMRLEQSDDALTRLGGRVGRRR